jgi:glycosyltransferase involved in cell wall biosynthesis
MSTNILISPISSRSGYGDCSRDIAKILFKMYSDDVSFLSTRWGSSPLTELNNESDFTLKIKNKLLNRPPELIQNLYQVSLPHEFTPIGNTNTGISAGYEFTNWTEEQYVTSNKMDRVIVHSKFSSDVLLNSPYKVKCQVPVLVIPQPVGTVYLNKEQTTTIDHLLSSISESFVLLSMGIITNEYDRKNIKKTIEVFQQSTAEKSDVALLLKISGVHNSTGDLMSIKKIVSNINRTYKKPKPVYILYGNYTQVEMRSIYTNPNVRGFISLTHGEGFGRHLLEASVCELPIIASNWSGHLDFLPENKTQLVSGNLDKVETGVPHTTPHSMWFYPDIEHAGHCIEDLYEDYNKHKQRAIELSENNLKTYTHENILKQYFTTIGQ